MSLDVFDLLARILVDQTRTILRGGQAHDYVTFEEELASRPGRVDVQSSVARQTRTRSRLACVYDELDIDRPSTKSSRRRRRRFSKDAASCMSAVRT